MKLLEGRVAVVTGAGGGLGRCHALALAAEGAKVVVNDPGVSRDGTGGSGRMADAVVEEIRKAGGEAVANYDSMATTEGAEAVVRTAVDRFGGIHVLVNNAGILRDKTIANMTDEMWDLVLAVHLRGTFACTRAAARVMKEKGTGGRIINTTSVAGLKGNFGQSNYGAAKAGIHGFTMTAALELAKDGITVNVIAPLAKTRMTEEIETIPAEYRPEDVSPVVVFLASDLARDVTGRTIGVHGRHLFEYRVEMTEGREKKEAWTPAEIGEWIRTPASAAPKPAAAGGSDRISAVFKALPAGFDAEKSAGWDAVLHFAIAGAGDWTVDVKQKALRAAEGKPAAPTCVVSVDAETLAGMIDGKVKPDMAFMAGKLKATNVRDLGKFGKVFDFRKIKAALSEGAPAAASPAAPRPAVDAAALVQRLPLQFLPDKAAGWNGTLLFKVDGGEAAIEIKDRACALRPTVAAPTCTVTTDGATLAALLDGALDAQKALSEGRIKVTHPPSWIKFRQVFRFEPERGLHRSLVGRRYAGGAILLRPERIAAYDEAVGDAGSLVFPVALVKEPFLKLFEDPEFNGDLQRMVHGEQLMVFHHAIRPWDLLSPRARVLGIEERSSGQVLNVGQRLYREGELVVEMESRLFFRGESKGTKPAVPSSLPPARGAATSAQEVVVAPDHPKRYAAASGDTNPIHLDESLAKSVGFKGVILHGLCTLALAARALPKDLERLQVRFSKPVYPGDTLTTSVWRTDRRFEFETATPSGDLVLTNGSAVVRA